MVKKDNRIALVAQRKQDQKQERERKSAGPLLATPLEVRSRIIDYCKKNVLPFKETDFICWVIDKENEKLESCCIEYLRTGECSSKRCAYSHIQTLFQEFHFRNDEEPIPVPLKNVTLRSLKVDDKLVYDRNVRTHKRNSSPLKFIQVGSVLVYDYFDGNVFANFIAKFSKVPLQQSKESNKETVLAYD
jgi:hypothetical protein